MNKEHQAVKTILILLWIIHFCLVIMNLWLDQKKQRKLLKLLKEENDKERAKIEELRNQAEYYKQKTMTIYFQNLVDCEKEIKWAEGEIENWKKELETERFQYTSIDFKQSVLINLIDLNALVKKTKQRLKKSQAVVSHYLKNGDISAEKIKEIQLIT